MGVTMILKRFMAISMVFLLAAVPALAQNHNNWVTGFLNRYRPAANDPSLALIPQPNVPTLRSQIQNGTLPLTIDALIRLILESSLDVTSYRFSPLLNQYIIGLNYLPFQPYLYVNSNVSRVSQPSSSLLNATSTLSGDYSVAIQQTLPTGSTYAASLGITRSSSNSIFNTFSPYYNGTVRYSFSQ